MASDTQENGTIKLDEDYLAELEAAAKGRYSEEDEAFMKVFNSPEPKPPIQPAEQFNRNRRGGHFRGRFRDRSHDRRFGNYGEDRSRSYEDRRFGGHRNDRQDYGGYGGKKSRWDEDR